MKFKFSIILLAICSGLIMNSCTTPMKITGSWMNKEARAGKKFQKIFLLVLSPNMSARQTVESDQARAAAAEGIATVKSTDVFPPNFLKSDPGRDAIVQKIKESGCDGVFTSALVNTKSETRYVPGTTTMYAPYPAYGYYGTFGGYYGYHSTFMYDPGYYVEDKTYYIESNLYDLATGDIVWSVQSEAYDASDLKSLSKEYAALLINKLKQEGVLSGKK